MTPERQLLRDTTRRTPAGRTARASYKARLLDKAAFLDFMVEIVLRNPCALENCESGVLAVARRFVPNGFPFRRSRLLGGAARALSNGVEQAGARPRGSAVSLEECSDRSVLGAKRTSVIMVSLL
jgi:hypothetical protein